MAPSESRFRSQRPDSRLERSGQRWNGVKEVGKIKREAEKCRHQVAERAAEQVMEQGFIDSISEHTGHSSGGESSGSTEDIEIVEWKT